MKLAKTGSGEEALPRTRAMFRTIEAWAQAAMGRGQAVRRTLGEAETLFVSDRGDKEPPNWMQMFDKADLHGMQALAYRTLAEHEPAAAKQAEHHAKIALELRSEQRESRMGCTLTLAWAFINLFANEITTNICIVESNSTRAI